MWSAHTQAGVGYLQIWQTCLFVVYKQNSHGGRRKLGLRVLVTERLETAVKAGVHVAREVTDRNPFKHFAI